MRLGKAGKASQRQVVGFLLVLVLLFAGTGLALLVSEAQGCTPHRPARSEALPEPEVRVPEHHLRSVAAWEDKFVKQWADSKPTAIRWSRSGDSWLHYRLAFYLDALDAIYRATGDTTYLDDALALSENVMYSARVSTSLPGSQYQDTYLGWESKRPDHVGQEVALSESFAWRYITSILRSMHQTRLDLEPPYAKRYDRLLAFAERNIFEKWDERGRDDNIFRSHTHMAAHWALIALNLSRTTERADSRSMYSGIADRINHRLPNYDSSLRRQLRGNPEHEGAYFWEDEFGSFCPPGSDVPHANGVIAYVVEAESQHAGWTRADMARFGLTLTEVIWPRGEAPAAFVDGSGRGNGWFSDGFVKLGRYDAALQRRLEDHQPANTQFTANAALNAALLRGQQAAGVPAVHDPVISPRPGPE